MATKHAENMREEYDFSQGTRGAVLPHAGKTRITIWIDTEVLDWFRAKAEREGRGYQTALNEVLRHYSEQDGRPLQEVLRTMIRQEVQRPTQIQEAVNQYLYRPDSEKHDADPTQPLKVIFQQMSPQVRNVCWRWLMQKYRQELRDLPTQEAQFVAGMLHEIAEAA